MDWEMWEMENYGLACEVEEITSMVSVVRSDKMIRPLTEEARAVLDAARAVRRSIFSDPWSDETDTDHQALINAFHAAADEFRAFHPGLI